MCHFFGKISMSGTRSEGRLLDDQIPEKPVFIGQTALAIELDFPAREAANPELERMWAWHRIEALQRKARRKGSRSRVDEIVRLGEPPCPRPGPGCCYACCWPSCCWPRHAGPTPPSCSRASPKRPPACRRIFCSAWPASPPASTRRRLERSPVRPRRSELPSTAPRGTRGGPLSVGGDRNGTPGTARKGTSRKAPTRSPCRMRYAPKPDESPEDGDGDA